ncbi:hypothetical protein LJ707_19775 [Mucilaginibacter sp. UR6-1]|uniref:hypothetical protein n=1 Tax=Mucilaginibacter sp. UR6-1 TaxID=1435643 RepID=UPI001E61C75E|nr:hypothetical protein [Mucilaginibacter sp. UR6-1]MCC8411190.1 hypothetical protein [Mucilaginibacter sp. UR6-1]
MKNLKIIIPVLSTLLMQACQQEVSYKQVRDEVITVHDKLMADDEKLMSNKMKLDTLATPAYLLTVKTEKPETDTAALHHEVDKLRTELTLAGNRMSEWMQKFEPEQDGRSNAEAVAYFEGEKQKVIKLDSLYRSLLQQSGTYLKTFNLKADTAMKGHHHMKM